MTQITYDVELVASVVVVKVLVVVGCDQVINLLFTKLKLKLLE